jgi:hypothetical protein
MAGRCSAIPVFANRPMPRCCSIGPAIRLPLSILAALANTALTVTVWAPVYVAAATVDPSAMALALPIMLTHALGLPAALLVIIRVMSGLFTIPRRFLRKQSAPLSDANEPGRQQPRHTLRLVKPRQSFGLRGAER